METGIETITLWRPVGPKELKLIEESGMRAFPPRLRSSPSSIRCFRRNMR